MKAVDSAHLQFSHDAIFEVFGDSTILLHLFAHVILERSRIQHLHWDTLCQFTVQFDQFGAQCVTTDEDWVLAETGGPQILSLVLVKLYTLEKKM